MMPAGRRDSVVRFWQNHPVSTRGNAVGRLRTHHITVYNTSQNLSSVLGRRCQGVLRVNSRNFRCSKFEEEFYEKPGVEVSRYLTLALPPMVRIEKGISRLTRLKS